MENIIYWMKMTPTRFGGGSNARYNSCGLVKFKNAQQNQSKTPNIEGVIGLGSAIEYLQNIGMERLLKNMKQCLENMPLKR